MERILEALETLPAGDHLHIEHRREPHLIYPIFEQQGYQWRTHTSGSAKYDIYVWRKDDDAASSQIPD